MIHTANQFDRCGSDTGQGALDIVGLEWEVAGEFGHRRANLRLVFRTVRHAGPCSPHGLKPLPHRFCMRSPLLVGRFGPTEPNLPASRCPTPHHACTAAARVLV
jgi:hypothetical protein